MGADLIGWRRCPLQAELGPAGFLSKLKLRTYLTLVDDQVAEEERADVRVNIMVHGPDGPTQRELTYQELVDGAREIANGIPECATCPLGMHKPLGCYHYVTYPIDAVFEELVFDFFVAQLAVEDSIVAQLYKDIVSQVPARDTGWHTRRGADARTGACAQRSEPLVHAWGGLFSSKRVDSAQILQSLFITLDHPALVIGYSRFWSELLAFAQERGVGPEDSPTLEAIVPLQRMLLVAAAHALDDGWLMVADA